MGFLNFFSRPSDPEPGETIEVLDDSGDTVEATFEGKGKHAQGRVIVHYTEGRYEGMGQYYEGMGQYVERERIVSRKAAPQPKDEY